MRRIAAVFVLALAVAGQAAAKGPGREPVLAITWSGEQGTLVRVDPVSLERADDYGAALGRWPVLVARSPDGRHVAMLDQTAYARLLVVDTDRMAVQRKVRVGSVIGAAWLTPHRLVLLEEPGLVGIFDPLRRRGVRWKLFDFSIMQWARTPSALVVLGGPSPSGLGPARLFIISADGRVRSVKLPGILAGWDYQHEHVEVPALAVDPSGERAVVVPACACAAMEVDLRSSSVHLHMLAARTLAKGGTGPALDAAWLGHDLVAVTGSRLEEHDASPLGLALLDTRDWSLRWVDGRASYLVRARDEVLAVGSDGVTAYAGDGAVRFRYAASYPTVIASGDYAYVRREPVTDVIELATGRVVSSTLARITVLGA